MKNKLKALSACLIILFFPSCEKVIQIDLNSADPKIVIEGNITDQTGPYFINLTQTVNYDQSNIFPPVTGATVKISDNAGTTESLTETSPGIYATTTIIGVPGRIYTLEVNANGKIYTTTSSMPFPVNIDTLTIETSGGGGFGGGGNTTKNVSITYTDPAGIPNYYRFVLFVPGIKQSPIIVNDDNLRDGQTITRPVRLDNSGPALKNGDLVTIQMQSIDGNVFEYLRTLSQLSGGNALTGSSAPANPKTNITGGALGYFSAYSVRTKSVIIF